MRHDHVVPHVWNVFAIDALLEVKLELRKERRHGQLGHDLNKALADADALATKEG